MNAVKKTNDIKMSDELLNKVFEQVQRTWFYQITNIDFQKYLKEIRPSIIPENSTMQKSLISTDFLVLVIDGIIEKKNTPFENHSDFHLKSGDTFYFSTFEHQEYRAQTDTLLLEIPLDRSYAPMIKSMTHDLDVLRTIKGRPNLLPIFKKYPQTELVKKICQQELDKTVKVIEVEKGKKLFLENNSLYFIDYGSISTSIGNQNKNVGEFILDFDEKFDSQTLPTFSALANSKICEYKINETTTSDVLLQFADKSLHGTKSQFIVEGASSFNLDYIKSKNSGLNLNGLKSLHPFNKMVITSSTKDYLKVSLTNIALALDSSIAQKINQDQLLNAHSHQQISIQNVANLLEVRGFFTRKRKISKANFNIQNKMYLWMYGNKICLILNNLNHADNDEVIAFESTSGFFIIAKVQLVKSPFLLEVEKSQFEKFQIENNKSTLDKAEFYGQKFFEKALSKRKILAKNLFTFKLFQTILVLLVPTLIYKYLNVAVTTKNSQIVYSLSFTLFLFLCFQIAALFLYNYYSAEFTSSYKSTISAFFHKIMLSQKMNVLKVGFVQSRISLSEFAFSALKFQKLELPIYGALLVFYIFYIGTYSLDASIALIAVFALAAGAVYGLKKRGGFTELNSVQLKQDLMDYYLESVKSLPHINLLKQNSMILKRINQQSKLSLVSSSEYIMGLGFINILGSGLFKCGSLLVLYLVVLEMIHNKLSPMQLFGVSLYLSYLSTPFQSFSSFLTNFNTAGIVSIPMQFLKMETQDVNKKTDSFVFNETISFNKVHFRYFEKSAFAIADISFKVRKSMISVFIGRTNSGKSTVLKLMTHALDHQYGSIQFDEKESNLFDKQLILNEMSYCAQIPELITGTILSNLLPQSGIAVDNHYTQILDIVGLYQSMSEYGLSMDSVVTNAGLNLPLKLRKQIQLARYIFDRNDLLIFDEPTLFMSDEEEAQFLNGIKRIKPQATTIFFTTKISVAKFAEKIFVLKNGRIVEEGEYYRLLNQNGELAEFYRNQIGEQ